MSRSNRLITGWYGVIAIVGLGFGLLGERRPFGDDVLAHPLIIYGLAVAGGCWSCASSAAAPCLTSFPSVRWAGVALSDWQCFLLATSSLRTSSGVDQAFTKRALIRARLTPSQG